MGRSKSPQIWSWSTNLQMPRKSAYHNPPAWVLGERKGWRGRCDCHPSFHDHLCRHKLTRRSLRWCLLCTCTTHTHRVNVRTCIIDLRLPLQQSPTVIKKRPFCFISPLHHAYRLICIISSIWCRPRKRLPLWFPLLGILSHFVVSLSAAPHAGAPHRRRILHWNRSGASAESCETRRAYLPMVSTI